MKLLVTGGAGYIGSVVASQLLAAGHDVTIFDDLSKGHRRAVPPGAHFIQGDILDASQLRHALAPDFDGVLHLAGPIVVPESVTQPERYYRAIVGGTLNLLDAMRETGVSRLVVSSTASVYGVPEAVPIPETAETCPTNPYGGAKLAADQLIGFAAAAHGLAAVSLRYFNVAGASGHLGEDHDPETHLIPLALQAAAGQRPSVHIYGTDYPTPDGTCIRDYIHVEDLARAHLLAVEASQPGEHRLYNLGNGAGFSVREVIDTARRVTGSTIPAVESPRRAGDPPILVASSRKIWEELGWTPQKPDLATIVRDAWEWTQAHPAGGWVETGRVAEAGAKAGG
jgi:UDP-glucose 4-epimerase